MSAIIVLILRVLIAIALFAFLGCVIMVLWKDLQQTIKKSTEYQISSIYLTLPASGLAYSFSQPEFYIGREPQADLQIPDETLSALHTRFFFKNNHWMVEDLQSTNGTYLNEDRLSTPSVLVEGDEITCGKVQVLVSFIPD
jgi:pSer/pThr/pTyr-binding forkhead associated (FHA) protein